LKGTQQSVHADILLWPTLTDSVLETSEFGSYFTQDQENIRLVDSSSPIKVEAIQEDDLERLGALNLSEKHAETYAKFSSNVDKVKDSEFYQKVLEYKQYYFKSQILSIKLEILKDSCKYIADKCWNVISQQAQFDRECGDGRLLTCFTTIDSAVFNEQKAAELINTNDQVLDLNREFLFNDYLANVAKLYVQNFLDEFLKDFLELLISFSTVKDKMDGWDSYQMIGI
jgi:hypothetical protein